MSSKKAKPEMNTSNTSNRNTSSAMNTEIPADVSNLALKSVDQAQAAFEKATEVAHSNVQMFDAAGSAYKARVTVVKAAGAPAAYGFQMIALKDAGNVEHKGFSAPGANVQLATTNSNGRQYAEHKGPSATNVFEMTWTAPASGSGSVTFYAAGNGVNSNNASGGDAAAKTTLQLTEESSATDNLSDEIPGIQLSQNPVFDRFFIKIGENSAAGPIQLTVFDLAGRQIFSKKEGLTGGNQPIEMDASNWENGIYLLRLTRDGFNFKTVKLVKV